MTQASPTSTMLLTPTSIPSTCEHVERQLDCQESPVMEPEDDPYYGHAATAMLCSKFIRSEFKCPSVPLDLQAASPAPTLAQFIAFALYRTCYPPSMAFAATSLLERLKERARPASGSSGHRLFITALMLISKFECDDTFSNRSWAVVAQDLFAVREIGAMEREMLAFLDWRIDGMVHGAVDFEARLRATLDGHPAKAKSKYRSVKVFEPITMTLGAYPTPEPTPSSTPRQTPDSTLRSPVLPKPEQTSSRAPSNSNSLDDRT